MNPILEGFMTSVALDVFSMPAVEWGGGTFDALLLCVDRATNWVWGRATQTGNLTGEKAAHLLLDAAWGR